MPKPILTPPIFRKPIGPSKHSWNNTSTGTSRKVICELCGTVHKADGESTLILDRFLGIRVVEECCGRIFDIVYAELGEEIVLNFFEDFAEDPTNIRFHLILDELPEIMEKAREKAEEVSKKTSEISGSIEKIKKALEKKK